MKELTQWEKLFNQKLKEVINPSSKYHVYATLSPTANGSCARDLIAEEYYQQADRIAELEKDLHMLQRHYDQLDHDLPSAEPVAWAGKRLWIELGEYQESRVFAEHGGSDLSCIPLYTTPQDQADRIAELEKELNHMRSFFGCDPAYYGMTSAEPVAWIDELGDLEKFNHQNKDWIPLYTTPQKYCPSEDNAAYEKGFIDGMSKQRQSSVDRFVNSNSGIIGQIGDSPIHDLVHRTTPKIKELSDEEILETVKDHFIGAMKLGIVLTNDNVLAFAKAILKKASEK